MMQLQEDLRGAAAVHELASHLGLVLAESNHVRKQFTIATRSARNVLFSGVVVHLQC